MKKKISLKDPKYRVPILISLIGVGMIALWYYYVYAPNIEKINQLEKRVSAKQDTLRTIQALKPQLNMLREELRLAENKLDSLKSIFPDQKEIPRLLRELTSVARATGITTTKFNPMPDIEKEYYVENHYNMSVSGGYHQLAEFFAFLANFTLIINLSSMNITTNPEYDPTLEQMGAVENGKETIVSQFEMTTFSSKK
jgi:type IV pilus assembly protein PilO